LASFCCFEAGAEEPGVILADFEHHIPCSECGDPIGFRRVDVSRAERVPGGPGLSDSSMKVVLSPWEKDLFFQGRVRRMYLATQSVDYKPDGPNALSFWIRLPEESSLTSAEPGKDFGVWTYHWRPGDRVVGGEDNRSLATDSMMHGYAFFTFDPSAAGRWIRMVLSVNAFQISRYYYHFYAGAAVTDDLAFFPSLRQLQFHFGARVGEPEHLLIDELRLIRRRSTARVVPPHWEASLPADAGTVRRPVTIKNPTDRDRRYRVFISSFIGVHRRVLHRAFAEVDGFAHTRRMQARALGDGGLGVVELLDRKGRSVLSSAREIDIPAGGAWEGILVHRLSPEMLGPEETIDLHGRSFPFRRDTLTTSVIVWDPGREEDRGPDRVHVLPSNADDGAHPAPPGFPEQVRPPRGWRSEDIPVSQVGGSFVSVLRLREPGGSGRTVEQRRGEP
jgi:hypothetical protein